jgi:hypothetical protein
MNAINGKEKGKRTISSGRGVEEDEEEIAGEGDGTGFGEGDTAGAV